MSSIDQMTDPKSGDNIRTGGRQSVTYKQSGAGNGIIDTMMTSRWRPGVDLSDAGGGQVEVLGCPQAPQLLGDLGQSEGVLLSPSWHILGFEAMERILLLLQTTPHVLWSTAGHPLEHLLLWCNRHLIQCVAGEEDRIGAMPKSEPQFYKLENNFRKLEAVFILLCCRSPLSRQLSSAGRTGSEKGAA